MTPPADLLPALNPLTVPAYERWIAAALAEAALLRGRDAELHPSPAEVDADPAALDRADRVWHAWGAWLAEASAVRDRVVATALRPAGVHDLHFLTGLAQMNVGRTPAERVEQLRRLFRGEEPVTTREELRRELELRRDRERPAEVPGVDLRATGNAA